MKVRITFEAGDCVEPEFIGKTFKNSGGADLPCSCCAFGDSGANPKSLDTACQQSCGCYDGVFIEV